MTPRRIVLTILALVIFGAAYAVYDRFLGWIDGLPVLPDNMLVMGNNEFQPPPRATSPTRERLRQAFGEHCPEAETAFYPTQLEFITPDNSIVLAGGPAPSHPGKNWIPLEPFSVAVFGKPRPEHLRQPGEVVEITTIHSDKAILYFDKVLMSPMDMQTAKLVRIELSSDPNQVVHNQLQDDHRRGHVHIANNQRSADPNRRFTLKTVGPVFYRDTTLFMLTDKAFADMQQRAKVPDGVVARLRPLKDREMTREDFMRELNARLGDKDMEKWKTAILGPASESPTGPRRRGEDIWTDAAIEAVDHSNVPHRPSSATVTAPIASEEVRNSNTVATILGGQRLPPPTVTAIGMKVFLANADSKDNKKGSGNFSGLKRLELLEQVTMHLWMEGGQGLVGSDNKPSAAIELPAATAGLTGALVPAAAAARELSRDLLQIETRGPFAFDAEKNIARFDVLPQTDPSLTNDVRATKIQSRPGLQTLFSQVLEIEFNGSPLGSPDAAPKPPPPKPGPKVAAGKEQKPASGPQFKSLRAWTLSQDRLVTISSDSDQLQAYGQELVRVQGTDKIPESTTLTGFPLYAVQQRSILTAGSKTAKGILLIETAPGTGERRTTITGKGRLEIYDPAAKANTMAASWLGSMVQTKEKVSNRELDLYTFKEGAKLEDLQSDYWLSGDTIKLWTAPTAPGNEPPPPQPGQTASPTSRSQLDKLVATGNVTAHSNDLDVEHTETLVAFFRDIPSPTQADPKPAASAGGKQDQSPVLPKEPVAPAPLTPEAPGAAEAPPEPQKPKPPMRIKAEEITTWVVRYPMSKLQAASGKPPPAPPSQPAAPPSRPTSPPPGPGAPGETSSGGMKYQLEHARCIGKVQARQDPDDPSKPRGTLILGSTMFVDSELDGSGSRLTVTGWELGPGEVHNEGTSLIGPKILIDQVHNLAVIEGRGTVMMPADNDMAGAEKKPNQKAEPITIQFLEGMKFEGSQKIARFFGKVNAAQGESWITCDLMTVNLDRPVFFSQVNQPAKKPPVRPGSQGPAAAEEDEKAKIDVIYCYPASDDKAETELEKNVTFCQIERDPTTGRLLRKQVLTACELTIRAQVRDANVGEPYRLVLALGPGRAKMWAPEAKEDDNSPSGPRPASAAPSSSETEMKLTEVHFGGRMVAKDKGDSYKEATFSDNVRAVNLPADNPDLPVDLHRLPPSALQLICREQLVVWTHKNPRLPDEPAVQYMYAKGNAYLQNDKYDGWGEEIRSEGKVVWFDGTKLIQARIKERFGPGENSGEQIRLDRGNNRYSVANGTGGRFSEGGWVNDDGLQKLPPPMPTGPAKPGTSNTNKPGQGTGQGQNPNQGPGNPNN